MNIYDSTGNYVAYGYSDASGSYTGQGLPTGNYFASTYNYYDYLDQLYNNIPCQYGNF